MALDQSKMVHCLVPCYWLCGREKYIRTGTRQINKCAAGVTRITSCAASVFSTAAYVLWNLTQNPTINFLHENKKEERASWWDTPLIDWEAYNGEYY